MVLYTHLIVNQLYNMNMLFKMHDSVPSVRYSNVCNILHLWRISLISTALSEALCSGVLMSPHLLHCLLKFSVYIYISTRTKKEVGMLLPKNS